MSYKIVESKKIVWCSQDDRYVLIVKRGNFVFGLNFMQGDELDLFKKNFNYIDEKLTDFYIAINLSLSGESELDRINQAIWAYLSYTELRAERNCNKQKIEL